MAGLTIDDPRLNELVPLEGSLPLEELFVLSRLLHYFTSTPDSCWFAIWDGYGHWWSQAYGLLSASDASPEAVDLELREGQVQDEILKAARRIQTPHREYFLFGGTLAAVVFGHEAWAQSPNLWWPADHAWCVATEIDGLSTYLGSSRACIDRVLNSAYIEAIEVPINVRMDPGPY